MNTLDISIEKAGTARLFALLFGFVFCLLWTGAVGAAYADDAPAWLKQAASAQTPTLDKNVPAVVLLDEQQVRVEDDGKTTTVQRFAVRILSKEGRGEALARAVYQTDTGKVREMKAWMIRPGGVKEYGKDSVADIAVTDNDIYNEVRVKAIFAEDDADTGMVFGYEAVSEDKSVFTQFEWSFQDRLPVIGSRFLLALPTGWRAESVTFNGPPVEPAVSGSSYTWELRNLPPIKRETLSPPVTGLAPRLAVSYFPSPGSKIAGRSFTDWKDVSVWLSSLSDPQAVPDPAITAKAKELAAGAKSDFEKIQAVGAFVQKVRYVSIQTGLGRGGGYRPHAAGEVFVKSYGDCKDKANLMRAMLKALDIAAYPIAIYSGDPTYVREQWPSPQQFNHCIIAVRVGDDVQSPTVVKHPTLGRLLVFDPTDDQTPVGDLPDHEQGSFALVVAGADGALLKMPTTPPETNSFERQTDMTLTPDGSIKVIIHEKAGGQTAASFRREYVKQSRPDYAKQIEGWLTQWIRGARLEKVEPTDAPREGRFSLDIEFSALAYAQIMQGRLMVFKPKVVSRRETALSVGKSRNHPVILGAEASTETVRVKLPAGFDVDEVPEGVKIDLPFGKFTTSYEVKEGELVFKRQLVIQPSVLPAAHYPAVCVFFDHIRAADEAPVVLVKK